MNPLQTRLSRLYKEIESIGDHLVCKSEHALHEGIGMPHQGPDAGYSQVPKKTLHGKLVSYDRTIRDSVDSLAFRAKVSLVPVAHNVRDGKINL